MALPGIIFYQFQKLSKAFSRVRLYAWLEQEIETIKAAGHDLHILNIGSGGDLYKKIKENGLSPVQIDIDPERAPDIVADICSLHMIADSSIDAFFMMEVLEHVKTPEAAVNEIYRCLKPGGKLVLSTPFVFPIHDEPHDYYRYTRYGLEYLLRAFSEVRVRERNDYASALMVLFARAMMAPDKTNRWIGLIFFCYGLIQYPFLWLFSKIYKNPQATTGYFVTAIKPVR